MKPTTILQRLIGYLRAGQPGMLLAEFIVVVLGLFLAFQVDRWYEERQQAQTVDQYIERLLTNIEDDIAEIQYTDNLAMRRMEMVELLDDSLETPGIAANNPDRYVYSLTQVTYITPFISNDATFSELISAGDLRLLPVDLRDAMYAYYETVADRTAVSAVHVTREEAFRRFAGVVTTEQMKILLSDIRTIPQGEFSAEEALQAAGRFAQRPQAIAWLPMLYASHWSAQFSAELLLPRAEEVRRRLLDLRTDN